METKQQQALVKNSADKEQVKKAGSKKRLQRRQQLSDLRALLDLPAGRRIIWGLLTKMNAFSTCYDRDPNTVYFKLGAQNLGFELLADVGRAHPTALTEMMTQQATEEALLEHDDGSDTNTDDTGK